MSKTVITLPGTDENSLFLRLTGTVKANDYEEFFFTPLHVDAPNIWMLMMKMFLPMMAGEMHYFETDEAEQAMIWVKE